MGFYDDDDSIIDEIREEEKFEPITFKGEEELLAYIKENVKCRQWNNYDYYGGSSSHFEVTYDGHTLFSKSDYSGSRTCWDR